MYVEEFTSEQGYDVVCISFTSVFGITGLRNHKVFCLFKRDHAKLLAAKQGQVRLQQKNSVSSLLSEAERLQLHFTSHNDDELRCSVMEKHCLCMHVGVCCLGD